MKDAGAGSEHETDTWERAVPENDSEECAGPVNGTGVGSGPGTDIREGADPW